MCVRAPLFYNVTSTCVFPMQWTTYPAIPQWVVRSVATGAVAFVAAQLIRGCVRVYQSKYDETVTGGVIDGSLLPIGIGMILMATLA